MILIVVCEIAVECTFNIRLKYSKYINFLMQIHLNDIIIEFSKNLLLFVGIIIIKLAPKHPAKQHYYIAKSNTKLFSIFYSFCLFLSL